MISKNIKLVENWRWTNWDGVGVFTRRGTERRNAILLDAVEIYHKTRDKARVRQWNNGVPTHYAPGGIRLHCEGGIAYDRDCRRLVKDGLMKIERMATNRSPSMEDFIIRWSFLVPTEKGLAEAERLMKKKAA